MEDFLDKLYNGGILKGMIKWVYGAIEDYQECINILEDLKNNRNDNYTLMNLYFKAALKANYPEIFYLYYVPLNNQTINFCQGNTYQIFDLNMTWTEAKEYCEEIGGHLVTITSEEEQANINSLLVSIFLHLSNSNCDLHSSALGEWKKIKNAKGYQLQAATNKKFKKKQIVFDKKTKNKKITIKGNKIKKNRIYYIRVRAYTTGKNTNGKPKYTYSKWTKKKVKNYSYNN